MYAAYSHKHSGNNICNTWQEISLASPAVDRMAGIVLMIIDRHAGFQRREDKGLPHRLGRHAPGKPGAAEINRSLLMDAAMDRPVRDEGIKRILRRAENQPFADFKIDGNRFSPEGRMVANGNNT
jgi:hypothetical protein